MLGFPLRFVGGLATAIAALASPAAPAADPALASLAAAIFAGVPPSVLSTADRLAIAGLVPLGLKDGAVVSSVPGCAEAPMTLEVRLDDLNADRTPEVFVLAGNTCTSGMTGVSVWLYAKQRDGWLNLLDVVASAYQILPSAAYGWHDLALLGRGHCAGVWRLEPDGRYRYTRSVAPDGSPCPQEPSR